MEGGHAGWRPNARARNAEKVYYYFGIVDVLRPWNSKAIFRYFSKKVATGFWQPLEIEPPMGYRQRLMAFVEDRVLPLDGSRDFLGVESLPQVQRGPRLRVGSRAFADGLSLVAAAEVDDEWRQPTLDELARWQALVDCLEASEDALTPWVEHGLVEEDVKRGLEAFRDDLSSRRLPPGCGGAKNQPSGVALAKIGKLVNSVAKAQSLRGKLLSDSSTQYSLALAIAVGVEAATLCSARLCGRCAPLFRNYPELVRRPAAVQGKRTFSLPEEGSWLSPPHMLPDLKFVEHAPEVFRKIRGLSGFSDQAYINCVCQREFSFIEFTTNSKSGEFFFFTHDGQCMVKTITELEATALLLMLSEGYAEHLAAGAGSLLARVFGLYQVQLPWYRNGQPQYFMIQENVLFAASKLIERFDLKGSTRGREAKPGEIIQKDNDWTAKGNCTGFAEEHCEKIRRLHRRDCEFLAACRVLDYSLLVGVASSPEPCPLQGGTSSKAPNDAVQTLAERPFGNGGAKTVARFSPLAKAATDHPSQQGEQITMMMAKKRRPIDLWKRVRDDVFNTSPHGPFNGLNGHLYYFGIIDFLVTWSCRKRAEYTVRTLQCDAGASSVAPPWQYARRQIDFVEQHVL